MVWDETTQPGLLASSMPLEDLPRAAPLPPPPLPSHHPKVGVVVPKTSAMTSVYKHKHGTPKHLLATDMRCSVGMKKSRFVQGFFCSTDNSFVHQHNMIQVLRAKVVVG